MKSRVIFLFTSATFIAQPVLAQSIYMSSSTGIPVPKTPPVISTIPQPQIPVTPQTPQTPRLPDPPPTIVRIPVVPQIPKSDMNSPINPMDVTATFNVAPEEAATGDALRGIEAAKWQDHMKESGDAVLVRATASTEYAKLTPYTVKFTEGEALISVRKPTSVAFVEFPFGKIALTPDSDILIKTVNDAVHITNFDASGDSVKIKLNESLAPDEDAKVLALARGYELIISARVLKRNDIRIADGCARRHFQMLDGGKVGICEISTESVLNSSAVVAQMVEQNTGKDHRILADLSKMAAVLNYVNGTQGYKTESAPNVVAGN